MTDPTTLDARQDPFDEPPAPPKGSARPLLRCDRCGEAVYRYRVPDERTGGHRLRLACACEASAVAGYRYRTFEDAIENAEDYQ